jgi:hypothetical protein
MKEKKEEWRWNMQGERNLPRLKYEHVVSIVLSLL